MTVHHQGCKDQCKMEVHNRESRARRLVNSSVSAWVILLALVVASANAEPPKIANVFPDFPSDVPRIITGEGFDQRTTEIWTWTPESNEVAIKKELANIENDLPPLPTKPPIWSTQRERLW